MFLIIVISYLKETCGYHIPDNLRKWRMTENDWKECVRRIIRSEMKRKGVTSKEMAELLTTEEYSEQLSEDSFNNKMTRGTFSAVFFYKCMKVLGVCDLRMD